jgi:hypothetical protein
MRQILLQSIRLWGLLKWTPFAVLLVNMVSHKLSCDCVHDTQAVDHELYTEWESNISFQDPKQDQQIVIISGPLMLIFKGPDFTINVYPGIWPPPSSFSSDFWNKKSIIEKNKLQQILITKIKSSFKINYSSIPNNLGWSIKIVFNSLNIYL